MNLPLYGEGMNLPWGDLRLVIDLFLGGLGVGAFVTAVISSYFGEKYEKVSKIGAYIAPIVTTLGLIILLTEFTQPYRAFYPFRFTHITSIISWGTYLQTLFVISALIFALLLASKKKGKLQGIVGAMGLLLAVLVGLYHGAFLSVNEARPLWNQGLIPVLFLVSALLSGLAFIVFLTSFGPQREGVLSSLGRVLLSLLLVETLLILVYLFSFYTSSAEDLLAIRLLTSGNLSLIFWLGLIGIGLILPCLIGVSSVFGRKILSLSTASSLISILVLIGVFLFKFLIITAAQRMPLLGL